MTPRAHTEEFGWPRVVLGSVLLVATCLRVVALGRHGFWQDEVHSLHLAENLSRTADPLMAHPPLYYVLLGTWLALGDSEAWVRALSVLIGLLATACLYQLAQADVGSGGALMATWLTAVSPVAIWASREARGYALLGLIALLAFWAVRRATDTAESRYWWLLGLAGAAGLYTHYYALFVLVATGVVACLPSRTALHRRLLGFAGAMLVAFLLFLPWLRVFLAGQQALAGYLREVNRFATGNSSFPKTLFYLLARNDPPHLVGAAAESLWPGRSFTFLSFGLLVVLLALVARRIAAEGTRSRLLPWIVMAVVPTTLAVVGHYLGNVVVGSRYVSFTGLFLAVPAGVLLQGLPPAARRSAMGVALVLGLLGAWSLYARPVSEMREAVRFIDAHAGSGDCVLTLANKAFMYRHYSRHAVPSFDLPWEIPGLNRRVSPATPLAERAIRDQDLPAILTLFRTCRKTFVLFNEPVVWGVDMGADRLRGALDRDGFHPRTQRRFSDTLVEVYGP